MCIHCVVEIPCASSVNTNMALVLAVWLIECFFSYKRFFCQSRGGTFFYILHLYYIYIYFKTLYRATCHFSRTINFTPDFQANVIKVTETILNYLGSEMILIDEK